MDSRRLIGGAQKRIRESAARTLGGARRGVSVSAITRALDAGEEVILPDLSNLILEEWQSSFTGAGQATTRFINQQLKTRLAFDLGPLGPLLAENSTRLRSIDDTQRLVVREIIDRGRQLGWPNRRIAQEIHVSIGLTRAQVQAVANYHRMLEQNLSSALRFANRDRRFDVSVSNKTLTAERIDRMVARYREKTLAERWNTIARTEARSLVHAGIDAALAQANAEGLIGSDQIVRTWFTHKDEKVRSSHRPMHKQVRILDQPFTSGSGASLRYPGDSAAPPSEYVSCRCYLKITLP